MKHISLLLFLAISCSLSPVFGQSVKNFHYQAVARGDGGDLLSNTSVNLRFQILETAADGPLIYQEKHTLSTNSLGLLQAAIGNGTVETGDFNSIDWIADDYYLVVELNGVAIDTTHFQAVPYAKVATNMTLGDLTNVGPIDPDTNQVLIWNGSEWVPGNGINLSGAGAVNIDGTFPNFTISGTDNVNDADANPANEIQSLSLSGNTLSLSLGGGSVNLASLASPWNNSGSNIFFNTGKVGIGDNSPVATLTVGNGDKLQINGSDGDIVFKDDQGTIRFANANGSNAPMMHMFQSGTNNSTRMVIAHSPNFSNWGVQYNDTADAFTWMGDGLPVLHTQLSGSKRIGVGTISPQAKVHIIDETRTGVGHLKLTEEGADFSRITMNNDVDDNFWDLAARTSSDLANAQFNIFHSDVGDIFSVNARKLVGINDPTPNYMLDIENANISSRSLFINHDNSNEAGSQYGILVDMDNTASSSNISYAGYFDIVNNSRSAVGVRSFSTNFASNSDPSYGVWARATNNNGTGVAYGLFAQVAGTGSGLKFAGYFSGDVFTAGSYLPSDAKLKTEIRLADKVLDKILALTVHNYQYDQEKFPYMQLPRGLRTGFLAGELADQMPELVTSAIQPAQEGEGDVGIPLQEAIHFQAVDYAGLVPYLVKAMQEQQAIIDQQKEKAAAQDVRIQELEQQLKLYENLETRVGELEKLLKTYN